MSSQLIGSLQLIDLHLQFTSFMTRPRAAYVGNVAIYSKLLLDLLVIAFVASSKEPNTAMADCCLGAPIMSAATDASKRIDLSGVGQQPRHV
jgi:hypothetical protein